MKQKLFFRRKAKYIYLFQSTELLYLESQINEYIVGSTYAKYQDKEFWTQKEKVQEYLRDIMGLIPDHCNKVTIKIKRVIIFCLQYVKTQHL